MRAGTTPPARRPAPPGVVTVAAALMALQVLVAVAAGAVNAVTADSWIGTTALEGPGVDAEVRAVVEAVVSVGVRALQVFVALAAVANATIWGVCAWATRDGQAWPRAVATILAALAASSAVMLPLVALAGGSPGFAAQVPQYSRWTLVLAAATGLLTAVAAALLWTRPARAFVEDVRLTR